MKRMSERPSNTEIEAFDKFRAMLREEIQALGLGTELVEAKPRMGAIRYMADAIKSGSVTVRDGLLEVAGSIKELAEAVRLK